MSKLIHQKFRYYFIRKKAPLSWIFWGEIMRRKSESVGMYDVSIAAVGDCGISLSRGAPGNNNIEIVVYDREDEIVDIVLIPLGYRKMGRVMKGFDRAFSTSSKHVSGKP